MASFGYRLNPRYAIKECLSCGALYTRDSSCSKGNVEDKILVPKLPKNCERCARCGHPVNGPYCQGCALLREKLEEDLVTYLKYFQDTSESSDDSTNGVNAPREPFVVKKDHGVNPPHIDKCCCECGNALDGIFCQQCTCKSCGKGAHIGYNCPPKVSIISNPEPYRLNSRYAIKECSSCGTLYTRDCSCSKGNVEDKILVPKPPKNCARCGHPVDGLYCQGCTFLQKKLEEDLDHESFVDKIICGLNKAPDSPHLHTFSPNQFHCFHCKDALGDSEACQRCTCKRCGSGLSKGLCLMCGNNQNSLNDSPSISANSSHNPPHIDELCFECGDALDGIFCQRCACKSCGKGAHIGYNCPPKVPIISNPEPCNKTMNSEPLQTLASFDSTCYSDKEISVPCVSKPNFVDESSNIFNPPPQPPIYSCEFCGSNAQYGHYCTPQAPFINLEPGYSQDFNFSQDIHDFQQQKFNRYSFFETPKVLLLAWDSVFKIKDTFRNEQYKLEDVQELFHKLLNDVQNIHEELAEYINTPSWNRSTFYNNGDDDDHHCNHTRFIHRGARQLSMEDEHLDAIPKTKSDEVIKSSVEDLVTIPSEFKGIPDTIDDDSLYYENIEYVEASPHDSEFVSLEVEKIVIPEDEEIEDDNLCEKLLKVNILIAKIEALKDNPTSSSEFLTKSSSTSPKSVLEETTTFHNSLPEFENFCFDLEEISSGSTTTQSDISLPEYDSFIFDLSNDHFPLTDRSDSTHEEFGDEPAHIISPPEYECFYFGNLPDPGELISSLNSGIRENLSSTTCVNLPVEDDHSPLLAYVVWIFLSYLTYPVIPPHLYSFGNEDTIFDPGITINCFYSFKPGLSHRCGTFKKFNTHRSHLNESLMEMLFSTLFPMDQL
uniref:Uncharacterized protein n=1 Tax=Tanacetum cinerariifolium TaxID=118510 RepID=A0A699IUA9_TANCI|nr:hypothetical protein [Tanacetum cinerariifolium]